ncbi:MAG: glycerol-3-phosphate 1-O-acyltransferase PlsY [Eubacteriales bacterium]|nr:glycerol-3-phosphate 1-O-acyltransferase PlsY [Eubacteriales bacterium]
MEFLTLYWWRLLIGIAVSYLLGSFSFAVIFTKLSKNQDVRKMGSGNAGFTNVLRSVGVVPAIFTFVFDCLKGIIAILITVWLMKVGTEGTAVDTLSEASKYEYLTIAKCLAGMFCVLGHSFPVFFGFKGGKGVTTMAGILLVLDPSPWLLVLNLAVFLVFFLSTKIISVGSIACTVSVPIWHFLVNFFFIYRPSLTTDSPLSLTYVIVTTVIMLLIGGFVAFMHRANIGRLIRGEEKKIKAKTS